MPETLGYLSPRQVCGHRHMNVLKRLVALTMGISWERTSERGLQETGIPVDDVVSASLARVHQRAREVALDKHRRALERDFQAKFWPASRCLICR